MNLKKFNTINRSEHFDAISINKKLDIETVKDKETGLRYFVVKNVLAELQIVHEVLHRLGLFPHILVVTVNASYANN